MPDRGEDAERHADGNRNRQPRDGQRQRPWQRADDLGKRWLAGNHRPAKVASYCPLHKQQILLVDRQIETKSFAQRHDGGLGRIVAEHIEGGIAWYRPHQKEDDGDDPDQSCEKLHERAA